MSDQSDSPTKRSTRHVNQRGPFEWRSFQWADKEFVARSPPEGTVELYIVSTRTRNPRNLARADAVLYDGDVVKPIYDEDERCIIFQHDWAGIIGRQLIFEFLDEPAVRLKELPKSDLDLEMLEA